MNFRFHTEEKKLTYSTLIPQIFVCAFEKTVLVFHLFLSFLYLSTKA